MHQATKVYWKEVQVLFNYIRSPAHVLMFTRSVTAWGSQLAKRWYFFLNKSIIIGIPNSPDWSTSWRMIHAWEFLHVFPLPPMGICFIYTRKPLYTHRKDRERMRKRERDGIYAEGYTFQFLEQIKCHCLQAIVKDPKTFTIITTCWFLKRDITVTANVWNTSANLYRKTDWIRIA